MKKFLLAALAVVSLSMIFISCSSDEEADTTISFSKPSVTLDMKEQTANFSITAKQAWTLDYEESWISVSPDFGNEGTTKVSVAAETNDGDSSRTATIVVTVTETSERFSIQVTQEGKNDVGVWIYEQLCENYYWNEAVKNATPNYSLGYSDFLYDLIANLEDAKDEDGTMDGGYYTGGDRYVYSYITRTGGASRASGEESTFGFGFSGFYYYNNNVLYYSALVTWVRPNSPAALAGLKRGMWIMKYNGSLISTSLYESMYMQVYNMEGDNSMTLMDSDGKSYTLSATLMELNPIIYKDVVESPLGRKAGYLVYNEFERGASLGNGIYQFDNYLRQAFGEFKTEGVEELILDLRYNPGGYVSSCRVLTSLIADVDAAPVTNGHDAPVFAEFRYNSSREPSYAYYYGEDNSLDFPRIYVLTTGQTASASEMVISSLRGIGVEVIVLGNKTEGKNTGMEEITGTVGSFKYEMWPITFRIYNALEKSDYPDGFEPDYIISEFRDQESIYELGKENELLLNSALKVIDGGTPTVDEEEKEETRAGNKFFEADLSFPTPARGGIKLVPADVLATEAQ